LSHWDRLILLLAGGILVASLVLSTDGQQVFFFGKALPGSCAFDSFFGLGCPGCGLTRSFVHTAHLNLVDAFRVNPLGPIGFLAVAVQVPWRLRKLRGGLRPPASG
jgi:hypothetical protein